MKIIKTDNYDRELYDDIIIAEKVHPWYSASILQMLNNDPDRSDEDYFMLVPDDHKLFIRDR